VKIGVRMFLSDRVAGCARSATNATSVIRIQMSAVDVDAIIKELRADRYISFNVLMGALSQL
jgi:hypothetical protein